MGSCVTCRGAVDANNLSTRGCYGSRNSRQAAIVCAASRGLGRAIATALAREGVNLVINARSEAARATLADDLRRGTGVSVTAVAADITSEEGRRAVLAATPNPDILVAISATSSARTGSERSTPTC
jgi:short-subunit dehydrogenase